MANFLLAKINVSRVIMKLGQNHRTGSMRRREAEYQYRGVDSKISNYIYDYHDDSLFKMIVSLWNVLKTRHFQMAQLKWIFFGYYTAFDGMTYAVKRISIFQAQQNMNVGAPWICYAAESMGLSINE